MTRKGKKRQIISLITITMISFSIINAEAITNDTNRNFKRITIEDGLSQSSVAEIMQDSKGYMWIGTNDGLNKYNGKTFEVYKDSSNRKNYISGNNIKAIEEDGYGNIWVGTTTGLNKINTESNEVTTYLPNENECNISNYIIRDIMISSDGAIIVGTNDGLNMYDEQEDNFKRIYGPKDKKNDLSSQEIYSVEEDINGDYWVGTSNGLNKINKDSGNIEQYFYDKNNTNTISHNDINSLYADEKGYLWIGTFYGGLNKLNIQTGKIERFKHGDGSGLPGSLIKDVLRDSRGDVWVGTDFGFAKFKEDENKFITYNANKYNSGSILIDDIYCIYEDKSGMIWIGTRYGINLFNPQNLFNYYKSNPFDDNSLTSDSISGVYEDNEGLLWVGTFNEGVNIFDRKNNKVTRIKSEKANKLGLSINSNLIREITGIDNEIWIATENGLSKYDKDTKEITEYNEKDGLICTDIRTLIIDKDGILWIGTRDGLFSFDRKNKIINHSDTLKSKGIKELKFMDIHEDSDGIIWMSPGIENGIVSFDKKTNEVKYYNEFNKRNNVNVNYCNINVINSDDQDNIWIGTTSGLIKFNKNTKKYTIYTEEDGLSNNFIYGILIEEDNYIWVSTNYGISKFDIKEEKFINFDSTDGIQGNEFNGHSYFKSNSGEMFFGGTNGLTSFRPENIREKSFTAPVEIESISTNYGNVELDKEIKLGYKDNQLQFEFFIPDYSNTKQIKYAYKLVGLDKEWILSEEVKSVNYSNLNPGKYEFKVAARSSSGEWSKPTVVKIELSKPPWKTNIAYMIYILLISSIVYLIWNRVKILDGLVKQRTIELDNKLKENEALYSKLLNHEKYKNNYFINLSHELRTPLNIISSTQSLIDSLNNQNKEIKKEKMSYYMSTIKRNCTRLINLIDNILDTSKIESDSYKLNIKELDIVYLVEEVSLSMRELTEAKKINLIIEPYIEEKSIECDALEIERVMINLISNAIKFTEVGGTIQVYIWDLGEYVKISVKDNGLGIDPKKHEVIFDRFSQAYAQTSEEYGGSGLGLTLSRQLIELHGGKIWVESELGKGSDFIIMLPTKYTSKGVI